MDIANMQLIIIGGGASIKEGIKKGLWQKLENKFVFGLNYSYNYFDSTTQFFVDKNFYTEESKKKKFRELPLIIGKYHKNMNAVENTLLIPACATYDPTLQKGAYKSSLCGIYATSVAVFLKPKEIYLLGFDYGESGKVIDNIAETHFYQGDIKHRGIGKINYYCTRDRHKRDFGVFVDQGIPIFNVSVNSKINVFPKITYNEFFQKLIMKNYNQDKLRNVIKSKLKEVTHS